MIPEDKTDNIADWRPYSCPPVNPGGVKHDTGKLRYDLVPPESLDSVVKVLTFGAEKYGDRNWEDGLSYGRLFAACMRHLWAWWRGESQDAESNLPHLSHAACCIFFLIAYEARGVGNDDRVVGRDK